MPDDIRPLRVICKGGLNTNENFLELSSDFPGMATRLVNYEASLHGGYRRINGYRAYDTTYHTVNPGGGEGGIYGIFAFFNDQTGENEIMASRKLASGNTYEIYEYQTGVGWVAYTLGVTQSSLGVIKNRFSLFNAGAGNNVIVVDGVNKGLVYDGATWYQLSSSNSGGTGSPGGDQCLDDPKYTTVFKNYVFIASGNLVAYSAPTDPLTWTSAAGAGQITPGFTIMAIKPFRDELYVFGRDMIKKIVPDQTATFVLKDVTANLGCIASDSVIEIAGSLLFLSPDGIRPVAGTERNDDVELSLISENIQYLTKRYIEGNNLETMNTSIVPSKTQFRYLFSDEAVYQESAKGIIGTFFAHRQQERGWEFGELLGIRASATWSGYLSGVEHVLHGDYNGKVYRQELTSTMDGNDIFSVYNTPFLDMGDTEIRKTMRKLNLFLRCEGDVTIDISERFDWRRPEAINPSNYQEQNEGAAEAYGEAIYGTSVYGSGSQPIFEVNLQGSGRSVQFSFVSDGDYDPYSIQAFVLEYSVKGPD